MTRRIYITEVDGAGVVASPTVTLSSLSDHMTAEFLERLHHDANVTAVSGGEVAAYPACSVFSVQLSIQRYFCPAHGDLLLQGPGLSEVEKPEESKLAL